ncbi:MAG: carboxypeptidase-like regulatory domain-containing protein, partial [Tannerella sp.]|nr:carboxypeptidase-like regulatory domain-containing protein [Tannerella sp.]
MCLLLMALAMSFGVSAQRRVSVSGVIIDKGSNDPIEQATIRLMTPKDSTLVTGVVSNENGSFTLTGVHAGNYLLGVSF